MTVQFEGDDVEHFTKVGATVPWQITAFLVFIRNYLQSIHGFCALSGAKVPEIVRQKWHECECSPCNTCRMFSTDLCRLPCYRSSIQALRM
jgi:hypothetical protein